MSSFKDRVIKSALLDPNIYEEVEADKDSMGQAATVVILSSVAAGIGAIGTNGIAGLVFVTVAALIGWLVWAFLTFYIGTKLMPEPETKSDYGELLRTIGFASSPGLIRILGIIPFIGTIVFAIGGVWMLVAMVIAVRQALDYKSTLRAVGVCVIGWIIQFVVILLLFQVFGVPLGSV
ncbi:MAG: YIP1 family protein [Thermodesulfobacteriota bacterium]